MNFGEIVLSVLKLSIVLTVLAIGLNATFADATFLFRRPAKLIRAIISMNLVMVVVAVLLVTVFNLHPAVKVALVALALSPVPPFLPNKALKAGGKESYTIGLLVAASLLAIVLVPLLLELLQRIFAIPLGIPASDVAMRVFVTILAPLVIGIVIRALLPTVVAKLVKPLSIFATVILVGSCLPVLIASWPTIWSLIGNGTVLALAGFAVAGLFTGHLLGGPDRDDRIVLALATASRHPAIAIAIAHTNFEHQKLVNPAILLYLLVSSIVAIPYLQWTRRQNPEIDTNKHSGELNEAPRPPLTR